MFGAKDMTVKLSCGAEMYYARFGRGSKTLVMVPGLHFAEMKGTAVQLAYFYRRFAKDFTVYVFERREGRDENATIRSMADDLADAMDILGLEGACVLGVSQGGMIAQYLAALHPEKVGRLVLGVTSPTAGELLRSTLDEWLVTAEREGLEKVMADSLDKMYTEKAAKRSRRLAPLMARLTRFISAERFADHARAIYTMDSRPYLKDIRCPTLVIGAEQDKLTTAQASRELAALISCKCVIIPNEGHAAYLSDRFNKTVYDFFKGR